MGGTIVVGVDGSESSGSALTWAAAQAARTGAALTVVTAYRFPLGFAGTGADAELAAPDEQHEAQRLQADMLDAVRDAVRDVPVECAIAAGEAPGHALVSAARDADLLVVGSRGRGGVSGFTIGSVSHYCVSHAPCPVVVVPGPRDAR